MVFQVILLSLLAAWVPGCGRGAPRGCACGLGAVLLGLGPPSPACRGCCPCVRPCVRACSGHHSLGQPARRWLQGLLPKVTSSTSSIRCAFQAALHDMWGTTGVCSQRWKKPLPHFQIPVSLPRSCAFHGQCLFLCTAGPGRQARTAVPEAPPVTAKLVPKPQGRCPCPVVPDMPSSRLVRVTCIGHVTCMPTELCDSSTWVPIILLI